MLAMHANCRPYLNLQQRVVGRITLHPFTRRNTVVCKAGSDNRSGRGFGKDYTYQDQIREQRSISIAATDLLAKLLQADSNAQQVATEYVDSLNEEFFHIGSAYLQMAKKEGDDEIARRLEAALRVAMEVKNSTLRPEIQLLNKLLGSDGDSDLKRKQLLNSKQAGETLAMNEFYFFNLLNRMAGDVGRQPDGPDKMKLQEKLEAVRRDAVERLPAELRSKVPTVPK